jgi:hypothetical protein
LFIAEFGSEIDKWIASEGSPWVVRCYAVILQEYDESLKPSDTSFSLVTLWVRILDLPFGWMNTKRGARAPGLVGEVKKEEADSEGKVSGPFLRARVVIDISKPLQRGIMLKTDKSSTPLEWFDIQYENLPFFASPGVLLVTLSQLVLLLRLGMLMGNYRTSIRSFVLRKREGGSH